MKKTLVTFIITVFALVACMTTVQGLSFGVKITPSSTQIKRGETVTLVVSVNNLDLNGGGLTGLVATIDYDTNVFNTITKDSFEPLNDWDKITFNPNNNKLLTAKDSFVKAESDVFKVNLTVKPNAKLGSTTVTFKNIQGTDNENDIDVANTSYSLQILEKTSSGGESPDKPEVTTKPTITQSREKVANGIKIILSADRELKAVAGWTLSSDKKQLSRVYDKNYSGTIVIEDIYGNKSDAITINVDELGSPEEPSKPSQPSNQTQPTNPSKPSTPTDKTAPTASVKYKKEPKGTTTVVTVIVTASEEIKPITGWTLSGDKKTLTKQFTANETLTITLEDLAGNKSKPIEVKVDMAKPNGGENKDNQGGNQAGTPSTPNELPKAGIVYLIPAIGLIALVGIVTYRKYKSMEY